MVLLLSNYYSRFILLDILEPNDPDDACVLTNDVVLTTHEGRTIALPAGTVLHGPCRHDLPYTGHHDPTIWKLYLEPNVHKLGAVSLEDAPRGLRELC